MGHASIPGFEVMMQNPRAAVRKSAPRPVDQAPVPQAARRLLLTGAGGFLGREVMRQALTSGWEIVAVSRTPPNGAVPHGVIRVSAEISGSGWQRWCEGCTAAIHLVGIVRESERPRTTFDQVHRAGTERVVYACQELGIRRLIHVSALGARRDAVTPYLRSKWQGEEVVRGSGLAWTIFRPSLIFGPGDGFFTTLARILRRLTIFPVFGSGAYVLQPISVAEVAAALLSALEIAASEGEVVELGGPEALAYTEVVRRTATALGLRRSLLHLPLGLSRYVVRVLQWLPGAPITPDQLSMLLAGSSCDTSAATLLFDVPRQRYEGPVWLRQ